MKDIVIIGGGAAGLMAAAQLSLLGQRCTLIEKNKILGKKLRITGKGRCNVTNNCEVRTLVENTVSGGRFLYGAFSCFSPEDTMAFFEMQGVPLKTERGNRVFPESDKAIDITQALIRGAEQAKIIHGEAEGILTQDGKCIGVRLKDNRVVKAECVLLSTGGASYPLTGSSGDGYKMAEALGHTIVPLRPSLVPLVSSESWVHSLSGISLRNVGLTLYQNGKKIYEDFGELLFTHFGLSGPLILSASAHLTKGAKCTVVLDLKPALSDEKLDARLMRELSESPKRQLKAVMKTLLPQAMAEPILEKAGLLETMRACDVTKGQREALRNVLKALEIKIDGFRPIDEAIITAGGVSVKEIQPKTMESKIVRGLYFAGEVIDADAYTGGFNLQIAFSTAASAARAMAEEGYEE